jgi:hypothetical protein
LARYVDEVVYERDPRPAAPRSSEPRFALRAEPDLTEALASVPARGVALPEGFTGHAVHWPSADGETRALLRGQVDDALDRVRSRSTQVDAALAAPRRRHPDDVRALEQESARLFESELMLEGVEAMMHPRALNPPEGVLVVVPRGGTLRTPAASIATLQPGTDRLYLKELVGHLPTRAGHRGPPLAGTATLALARSLSTRTGHGGLVEVSALDDALPFFDARGALPISPVRRELVGGRPLTVQLRERR